MQHATEEIPSHCHEQRSAEAEVSNLDQMSGGRSWPAGLLTDKCVGHQSVGYPSLAPGGSHLHFKGHTKASVETEMMSLL